MSELVPPDMRGSTAPRRTRGRLLLYGLLGLVLLILVGPSFYGPIELMLTLPFGWIHFLARTVPRIHWNWDLIGMAVVCVALILAGTQWFATWLTRSIQLARGTTGGWQWPWKWTWCGLVLLLVGFLVGMSVGGIVHQAGWITASPEPLMERKGFPAERMNMYQLEMALQTAIEESEGDLQKIRQAALDKGGEFRSRLDGRATLLDSFHVLLITEPSGKCKGAIMISRDAKMRERYGGWYMLGNDHGPEPHAKLIELIGQYGSNLVSL